MREDTKIIHTKYNTYIDILCNERFDLFTFIFYDCSKKEYVELYDHDTFIDYSFRVLNIRNKMLNRLRLYNSSIRSLYSRYEKKKIILKRNAYRDILRPYFCTDIIETIIVFIC